MEHWADRIAQQIIDRAERDPILRQIVKEKGFIVYDEKTPSGNIHVGAGRGWVIHDCVAKALRDKGVKARFVLSSDDLDPYDKPNKDLDASWNEHLGRPFADIPSPKEGYKSFGDYFFSLATDRFKEWGIEADLESTAERYKDGSFNEQIKTLLDNADKVQAIYAELYGEDTPPAHKLPFNVKCPECGKIATTLATKWDQEKEEVFFQCTDSVVDFAKGCGHEGWISPYNGNGKFPWKVEWAAKWPMMGVAYEIAGKDHFTKGGSRTIACKISVDVLDFPPPVPSDGYRTGKGYEFFTVGGAKMSTSKGKGISFAGVTEYAPARMLRYLMVKSRPNAVIDFNPYNDNDLILLYDRYDKMESIYFGKTEVSEDEKKLQSRIYELSVDTIPKNCPPHISLHSAAMILQITLFDKEQAVKNMQQLGMLEPDLGQEALEHVHERLSFAEQWVKDFASDQYKFEVKHTLDPEMVAKLSDAQRAALEELNMLWSNQDETELSNLFYEIKDKVGIDTKEFFQAVYLVLIGKEKGPRLAKFLLSIGQEKVSALLSQLKQ